MKAAVVDPVAAPAWSGPADLARRSSEDRKTPRRVRWGALYAILLASVGLCVGGSRLVAAVGHAPLVQYGVALLVLGLLAAWVRGNRAALSSEKTRLCPEQPFSVIHVPLSPRPAGEAIASLPDPEPQAGAACEAPGASRR